MAAKRFNPDKPDGPSGCGCGEFAGCLLLIICAAAAILYFYIWPKLQSAGEEVRSARSILIELPSTIYTKAMMFYDEVVEKERSGTSIPESLPERTNLHSYLPSEPNISSQPVPDWPPAPAPPAPEMEGLPKIGDTVEVPQEWH